MKVSIVIPIYNVSRYLRKCLDSCINQTYKDLEIICINDGSTDDCGRIIEEYKDRDTRVKAINKINGGLPLARKSGIEMATGEYIFHLDGDDDIPENAISELIKIAELENSDIVVGDYHLIDVNGKLRYCESRIGSKTDGREYVGFILKEGLFNIWGKLIRRTLYQNNDISVPSEISIGEDLVAVMQLAYFSRIVSICKTPVYNYYIRTTSMSRVRTKSIGELTDRSIHAVVFITRFLLKRVDGNVKKLLVNYVQGFVYEYLRSPHSVDIRKKELQYLCKFLRDSKIGYNSICSIICNIAYYNLPMAKTLAKIRNMF